MKTLEDVLEEITPAPDADFAAEMERRMELGFPPRRRSRTAFLGRLPRLSPPPARARTVAAVAASALLALLVTVSVLDDGGEPTAPQTLEGLPAESGAEVMRQAAPDDGDATTALPQPVPPPGEDIAPGAPTRRIERSAQLVLAADPDEFDAISGSIFRIAARRDGFVVRSSLTQGEDGLPGGSFALRVPTAQLPQALNELSRLATVRSRSESGNDVTGAFVSARDRLRAARAEQRGLLRRLERADTDAAVRALRRQLGLVQRRIAQLREQLRSVRQRTEFATVAIELVDEDAGVATGATREAFDDAVGSLESVVNFAIRALGVLVPLGILALLAWLLAARGRRRARERALA